MDTETLRNHLRSKPVTLKLVTGVIENNITYLDHGEPSPECNSIVCGQVLNSFEQYFEHSGNQDLMILFAESQLKNSRKSIAKKAKSFLVKHSIDLHT